MKRLSIFILFLIACGTVAAPHLKVKHAPVALTQALHYTMPAELPASIIVETFIGPMEISEPLIIELLQHPVVTRMKEIDQHGPLTYFGNQPTFSRYDHCIGVFALLRKFNRPLEEQVAGLLHDASHTVFSHVADHLFKTGNTHAYQDTIHEWYLHKMNIDSILKRYDLSVEEINPDQPQFSALEQQRPKLCADRIQYILYTGLKHERITQEQLMAIVDSLTFIDGNWIITNQEHARTLADLALHFTEYYWQSPDNFAWFHWLCQALKQAIALDLITSDDIHFGTDNKVLDVLNGSTDKHIKTAMDKCKNCSKNMCIAEPGKPFDTINYPKIMFVDPLVQEADDAIATTLMQRDEGYRQAVVAIKQRMGQGIKLQLS